MPFPLDRRFVLKAEEKLGRALPLGYVEHLCRNNGGEVAFETDEFTLYPIQDTSDRKRLSRTCNDIVHETRLASKWKGFPDGAVAIGANACGDKLIFLPDPQQARFADTVYWWDHETGTTHLVSTTFEELL